MPQLPIIGNDVTKDVNKQLQQTSDSFLQLSQWATRVTNKGIFRFVDTATSDISTASTVYVNLDGFNGKFVNSNPIYLMVGNIGVSGNGWLGLFINNNQVREWYFSHGTNIISVPILETDTAGTGTNSFQFKWKAATGNITKPFLSRSTIEILNFNS